MCIMHHLLVNNKQDQDLFSEGPSRLRIKFPFSSFFLLCAKELEICSCISSSSLFPILSPLSFGCCQRSRIRRLLCMSCLCSYYVQGLLFVVVCQEEVVVPGGIFFLSQAQASFSASTELGGVWYSHCAKNLHFVQYET